MQIPITQTLFWDCDAEKLEIKKHARFIIDRILSRGVIEDFRWARKTYGDEEIKEVVVHNRTLDRKSQNFWCAYFHIDPALCIRNLSNKKQGLFWKQ